MSDHRAWLRARSPAPPEDLRLRIEGAVDPLAARHAVEVLARAAGESLESAVARPGRVRESALHLLVADALVTYACEAALEADQPEVALRELVEVGRAR